MDSVLDDSGSDGGSLYEPEELDECAASDECDDHSLQDELMELDEHETDDDGEDDGDDGEADNTFPLDADLDPRKAQQLSAKELQDAEVRLNRPEANGFDFANFGQDQVLFDGNLQPAKFYRQAMAEMDVDNYMSKEYAETTEKLIQSCENQWRLYCQKVLRRSDWQQCFRTINFRMLYQFLNWYLSQVKGRGGRAKRRIRAKSSLTTFWCNFRLAFERVTFRKINAYIDGRLISNALAELGRKFKLTHQTRVNRSMTLKDLKAQLQFTLSTTEKTFFVGEARILAILFLLFLAPAGSRPGSILKLRFGDIRVLLVRDPEDPQGPPRLVIKLSLAYTKRYLGAKATKHFIIPEILYDPSLLLSPHVFLLAILFRHRAFRSEALNNDPHVLSRLKINPSSNEMPLSLRPELDDVFVFRKVVRCKVSGGYRISTNTPINANAMGAVVKRIGALLGFEHNTICYSLRYMTGNNLDQSVNVSDSLRNLILDHAPSSDTFQGHYLSRVVQVDVYAIQRNARPQQGLIQQAASHGHSRNSHRPVSLTDKQMDAVLQGNRQYMRWTEELSRLPKGHRYAARRDIIKKKRNVLRGQLREAEISRIRAEWDHVQAVDDIERQARGEGFLQTKLFECNRDVRPMTPAQQRTVDAVTAPLNSDLEAVAQRRTAAINALVAYCLVEEPSNSKLIQTKKKLQVRSQTEESPAVQYAKLWNSVFVYTMGHGNVRSCFICVARALTLSPEDPVFHELGHQFRDRNTLTRHFGGHLKNMHPDDTTDCTLCSMRLTSRKHLQNHAELIHGVPSRQFK